MKKTNKKENQSIITIGIVLMNNKGDQYNITVKRIERIDEGLLTCKFQGEKNLHVLKSSKLLEISSLYAINYVGHLKLLEFTYDEDGENYDVFKINRRYYRLEGIFVNKNLITLQNLNIVEQLISDILNNFKDIKVGSIVVRDIDSKELRILELKKIDVYFEMGIPKINMKIKGYKNIKRIDLNEYSILFEMLYNLASMKIEYFTDA